MAENKAINFNSSEYLMQQRTEEICQSIKTFTFNAHRNLSEFFNFNDGKTFDFASLSS
jgi:hypothetical protein